MTIEQIYSNLLGLVHGETGRDHRKLANNTYGRIEGSGDYYGSTVVVKLHDTDIIKATPTALTLSTGGWFTVTTKERLHRFTPGLHIWSNRGVWFVSTPGTWDWDGDSYREITPSTVLSRFFDGMVLRDGPNGVYVEGAVMDDPDMNLRAAIKRYVDSYTDAEIHRLVNAAQSGGAAGDCLYCQMGSGAKENRTLGADHLLLHVAEDYRMATLLRNAIREAGFRDDVYLGGFVGEREIGPQWHSHLGKTIRRAVLKMLKMALLNKGLQLPTARELENA